MQRGSSFLHHTDCRGGGHAVNKILVSEHFVDGGKSFEGLQVIILGKNSPGVDQWFPNISNYSQIFPISVSISLIVPPIVDGGNKNYEKSVNNYLKKFPGVDRRSEKLKILVNNFLETATLLTGRGAPAQNFRLLEKLNATVKK